jgi:hypothetical protein
MKRTVMLLSSAALALSFAAAKPARAGSPPNAAVQGTWAFGTSVQYEGDAQSNGTLTFDGNGGVTGVITYNDDGTVCQGMTVSGTYNVNPGKLSGTAVMTVTSVNTSNCALTGDGDTLSIAFSMFNGLKGMNFLETDPEASGYFYHSFDSPLFGVATHF